MRKMINSIRSDENGAVTVDWVVLTAAVVGLAVAIVLVLKDGTVGVSVGTEAFLKNWTF
ncbi:hypothetical protein [Pseudosulfitobacter pseudonitzschiae]|uniref:hypothetical protein n=1 Tax=Pseudosulfitobacter pseudonitzschiae TaxID=1402135 RepID=UPI00091C0396|nr:hypothetical protein [Pseudosulfitobacter pseudonitzschiae]MBM1815175.1 hypothetical protein [Pseudosulfitobacter pseudonitzschiae]MBM1832166.1 hypothetical protein [Pseudosulfitobacter pseudonitzschiae]MBM1837034.1 hypothetical protein [Pseudosulfitobacter pseudonitzschiae]MBM1841880.1 hypothetical protein [Pseudosulfitobacter pseudonitzschiae]MBM1846748.1 hypothetical protein [Pseudosulfitobacter pseudonitzschiae]